MRDRKMWSARISSLCPRLSCVLFRQSTGTIGFLIFLRKISCNVQKLCDPSGECGPSWLTSRGVWRFRPLDTESRKDQVNKRFSNPVFDFRYPICGTCTPYQKSQKPHITPIYYTLSLCLYYYFKYLLSLILLSLSLSLYIYG
jgi:hypothetical protein